MQEIAESSCGILEIYRLWTKTNLVLASLTTPSTENYSAWKWELPAVVLELKKLRLLQYLSSIALNTKKTEGRQSKKRKEIEQRR